MRRSLATATPRARRAAIIAIGKAAPGMATALAEWLAATDVKLVGGVVAGADDGPSPAGLIRVVGDHPAPAAQSLRAANAVSGFIATLDEDVEVHVALSGGGTALVAAPTNGITHHDILAGFDAVLRAGLPIHAMNALRQRWTRFGGGKLARLLAPRPVSAWIISDVHGDDVAAITSGPCSPPLQVDAAMLQQLRRALPDDGLSNRLWATIGATANAATTGFEHVTTTIVASNADALRAAAVAGAALNLVQRVSDSPLDGDARVAGTRLATELVRAAREWHVQNEILADEGMADAVRGLLLIWGGETTVAVGRHAPAGGRCQQLALSAAELLDVSPHPVAMLAAGTDGRDGPTDAAGAVVDTHTWTTIADCGVDPGAALDAHDAYRALDVAGALLRTGLTGTNVMDVVMGVVDVRR